MLVPLSRMVSMRWLVWEGRLSCLFWGQGGALRVTERNMVFFFGIFLAFLAMRINVPVYCPHEERANPV